MVNVIKEINGNAFLVDKENNEIPLRKDMELSSDDQVKVLSGSVTVALKNGSLITLVVNNEAYSIAQLIEDADTNAVQTQTSEDNASSVDMNNPLDIDGKTWEEVARQAIGETEDDDGGQRQITTVESGGPFPPNVNPGFDTTTMILVDTTPDGKVDFLFDTSPVIGPAETVTISEVNLADGTNPMPGLLTMTGDLNIDFGVDGFGSLIFNPFSDPLSSHGNPLSYQILNGNVLQASANGSNIFNVTLNPDATYTYELQDNLDHKVAGQNVMELSLTFSIEVKDSDDVVAQTTEFTVIVVDDMPVLGPIIVRDVFEKNLSDGTETDLPALTFTQALNIDYGADGPAATTPTTFKQETITDLNALNITSEGETVIYTLMNNDTTIQATADGRDIFKIDLNENSYTFELQDNIDHKDGLDNVPTKSFTFKINVMDFDMSLKMGMFDVVINDDMPKFLFPVPQNDVDEGGLPNGNDQTATTSISGQNLFVDFGADGFGAIKFQIIINQTDLLALDLKSGGQDVSYTLSNNDTVLTASAGGEDVFIATLNNDSTYDFDLLKPLDHISSGTSIDSFVLKFVISFFDGDWSEKQLVFSIGALDDDVITIDDMNMLFANAMVADNVVVNDSVGADLPGRIGNVTHDGITYTLSADGSTVTASDGSMNHTFINDVLTFSTALGGILEIQLLENMTGDLGDYKYSAPSSTTGNPSVNETFTYELQDFDLDGSTATLSIEVLNDLGSIGDFVWEDLNTNGLQDTSEPGIEGITVNLLDATGTTIIDTTVTDVNGLYTFADVMPNNYIVEVINDIGARFTLKDVGVDDTIDSDVDETTGLTDVFTLNPGETKTDIDAGLILEPNLLVVAYQEVNGPAGSGFNEGIDVLYYAIQDENNNGAIDAGIDTFFLAEVEPTSANDAFIMDVMRAGGAQTLVIDSVLSVSNTQIEFIIDGVNYTIISSNAEESIEAAIPGSITIPEFIEDIKNDFLGLDQKNGFDLNIPLFTFPNSAGGPTGAGAVNNLFFEVAIDPNIQPSMPLIVSIAGDVSVTEGNLGTTTTATVTVNLSEMSSENIVVRYTTGGGDANPLIDPDYAPNNGELVFLAGETSKTIDVTIFGDNAFEADETFNVTINSVSTGVMIGNQTGVVTIQNDDAMSASGLPLLSSNPGANAVLYLDFDGEFVSGTDWNNILGNTGDFTADAYDIDNNPTTFNAQEQQDIINAWRVVQEDFAPFDINVTTDVDVFLAADVAMRTQVVISTTSSVFVDPFFGGGVAFQGSFGVPTQQPAFTFYDVIFGGSADIYDVGMVSSHETGHQLGLSHDGIDDGMTFLETSPGHGTGVTSWGPIMGFPYGQSVTQWSQGEYIDATNLEDDLSIIAANSFGFRIDDHSDDLNNATLLHLGSGNAGQGIIGNRTDVDYFEFSGSGNFTIDVNPLEDRVANLDILAELYDENGVLLASSNPTNALNASITFNATMPAKMFLAISGTGKEPVTTTDGYTDYGSLGHYVINITGLVPDIIAPNIVAVDDAFTTDLFTPVSGNVLIDNTGNGPDFETNGDTLTVVAVNGDAANVGTQITLPSGALLTVNTNGTFNYDPNGAFQSLNSMQSDLDSFNYTISNTSGETSGATVILTISGQSGVWYVDSSAPSGGNGSFANPFNDLSQLNGAGGVGDVDGPGDIIYLFEGTYTGGLELEADQQLIGSGVDFTDPFNLQFVPMTNNPVLEDGVTLATNNTIQGLTLGNTASFSLSGNNYGDLSLSDVSVINTLGGGISLSNSLGVTNLTGTNTISVIGDTALSIVDSAIGLSGVTFESISASNNIGLPGIVLENTGSGDFTVTGVGNTAGSGGTIDSILDSDAIQLLNINGHVTLTSLNITNITSSTDATDPINTRSGVDGIHGEQVLGGLTLDNVLISNISDNAINGAQFIDGVSPTIWNGLEILNSTLEFSNRYFLPNVGDASDEGLVRIVGLKGDVVIDNSLLQQGGELLDFITDTSGMLDMLVQSSSFLNSLKELPAPNPTINVGKAGIDVTVQGSLDATVIIGDHNQLDPLLGNTFINNGTASIRLASDAGSSGTIGTIISKNIFEVNDHLTSQQMPGNFLFNFPQGGVLIGHRDSSDLNAIVSHNLFDQVMNAAGGFGQLTLDLSGNNAEVIAHDNTFKLPWNGPVFVRADGNNNAEVLFDSNTYIGEEDLSPAELAAFNAELANTDLGAGGFPFPFLPFLVEVEDGGSLDLTLMNENLASHDPTSGFNNSLEVTVESTGGTLNLATSNVQSPDGFGFNQNGGTINVYRDGSTSTDLQTVLDDNGNSGGGGNDLITPPVIDVVGVVTLTDSMPTLPAIMIVYQETNTIIGTDQNDVLNGTNVDDLIKGLAGDDIINANNGPDVIKGGLGSDTMTGDDDQASTDTYSWLPDDLVDNDVDLITDFDASDANTNNGDILKLGGLTNYDPLNDDINDHISLSESSGNTTVSINASGSGLAGDFVGVVVLQNLVGLDLNTMLNQGNIDMTIS